MTDPTEIERLRRRLGRERAARLEAERIAEDGIRRLYEANRELDERIAQRTSELADATRRAEAASRAKTEFLAAFGHEAGTPMNGVLGMLELIGERLDDAQAQEWLRAARGSAERMNRIFRRLIELLQMEGVTEADQRLEEVDLGPMLRELEAQWAPVALRAGKLLTVDAPRLPSAASSAAPLGRLLDELLDNAVVHATPGPLRVVAALEGESLTIEIRDSGPGFDASELAHLLAPFDVQSRDESTSRGLPLGLALANRLRVLAGARLDVADDEGMTVATVALSCWPHSNR